MSGQYEYAVMNQDGVLFGLPAQNFKTYEGAGAVLSEIGKARDRASQRAVVAEAALEDQSLSRAAKDAFTDDLRLWAQWKKEVWFIVRREATPWEQVIKVDGEEVLVPVTQVQQWVEAVSSALGTPPCGEMTDESVRQGARGALRAVCTLPKGHEHDHLDDDLQWQWPQKESGQHG